MILEVAQLQIRPGRAAEFRSRSHDRFPTALHYSPAELQ